MATGSTQWGPPVNVDRGPIFDVCEQPVRPCSRAFDALFNRYILPNKVLGLRWRDDPAQENTNEDNGY